VDPRPRRKTRGRDGDIDPARPARFASSQQRVRAPGSVALRASRRRARLIPRRPCAGPRTPSASRPTPALPVEFDLEPGGAQSIGSPEGAGTRPAGQTELAGQRQPSQPGARGQNAPSAAQPSHVRNCLAAEPACEADQKTTTAESETVSLRSAVKKDQTPCLRASLLRARAISWGSVRLLSSAI
jgi:hypothetical protein